MLIICLAVARRQIVHRILIPDYYYLYSITYLSLPGSEALAQSLNIGRWRCRTPSRFFCFADQVRRKSLCFPADGPVVRLPAVTQRAETAVSDLLGSRNAVPPKLSRLAWRFV
jgi:hypothetical protein